MKADKEPLTFISELHTHLPQAPDCLPIQRLRSSFL